VRSLWRSPAKHIDLLPQDQVFRFQRCSRLEARSQDTENQLEQIGHQDASLRRPLAAPTPNRIFGTHNGLLTPEVAYRSFQDPLRQILPRGNRRKLARRLAEALPCAEHTNERGFFQQDLVCRNLRFLKPTRMGTLARQSYSYSAVLQQSFRWRKGHRQGPDAVLHCVGTAPRELSPVNQVHSTIDHPLSSGTTQHVRPSRRIKISICFVDSRRCTLPTLSIKSTPQLAN
jgi:hypothetical protein